MLVFVGIVVDILEEVRVVVEKIGGVVVVKV